MLRKMGSPAGADDRRRRDAPAIEARARELDLRRHRDHGLQQSPPYVAACDAVALAATRWTFSARRARAMALQAAGALRYRRRAEMIRSERTAFCSRSAIRRRSSTD